MKQNKWNQIESAVKRYWINRKYKDRLFCKIFEDKRDLLQLYNAINNTSYANPDDLIITTLDDTIILSMKNDVSFIISARMNLYEHQSTFNPNMPIRGVFYFSRLYEIYIAQHGLDLYGSKLIKLPTPQYVIFYNGDIDKPDRMTLKLSDAFDIPKDNQDMIPALECTAVMLNINYGHNEELLNKCKRLKDYAYFVAKVKELKKTEDSLKDAVDRAIDECIKEEVLVDILLKHRTLARNALLTEYDEKKRRRLDRKEGYDDGIEKGIEVLIQDKIMEGREEDYIVSRLIFFYQLSEEDAKKYVEKYRTLNVQNKTSQQELF